MTFQNPFLPMIAGSAVLASTVQAELLKHSRAALVMIEYQNEWVSEKGNLRNLLIEDQDQFEKAINQSKYLLEMARGEGVAVVHITLKPDSQYRIFDNLLYLQYSI